MSKQIAVHNRKNNKKPGYAHLVETGPDNLTWWMHQYFKYEVSTAPTSRKAQGKDIVYFLVWMNKEEGSNSRVLWSPRLSRFFLEHLRTVIDDKTNRRRWGDNSIKRILAHLKTFANWVHKLQPFPLGNPMEKITATKTSTGLEIERALTKSERRRILDAADQLPVIGGRSRDRKRFRKKERPQRKGYRPYRNRAIIYTLIETGMRRAGAVNIILDDIDFKKQTITTREKGGQVHTYHISREGVEAIRDYLKQERPQDYKKWKSNKLFLTSNTINRGTGKITAWIVNSIWNEVCQAAGVEDRTPHSARHAMGRYIIEKTGNVAAVQRQLGHKNASYSMQYARITSRELKDVLDKRE